MSDNELELYDKTEKNWMRFGMIASTLVAIAMVIVGAITGEMVGFIILGYAVLAFGTHLGHECMVYDVFLWGWDKSISMPGIIFDLDIDGILFWIAYKCIIAPLVSFILGALVGLLGTILAILLSLVSFPFKVITLVKEVI